MAETCGLPAPERAHACDGLRRSADRVRLSLRGGPAGAGGESARLAGAVVPSPLDCLLGRRAEVAEAHVGSPTLPAKLVKCRRPRDVVAEQETARSQLRPRQTILEILMLEGMQTVVEEDVD